MRMFNRVELSGCVCVCVPRFALQLLNECVRVKMASAESARMLNILWIWEGEAGGVRERARNGWEMLYTQALSQATCTVVGEGADNNSAHCC